MERSETPESPVSGVKTPEMRPNNINSAFGLFDLAVKISSGTW
jgi:hypothetical protein